MKKYRFYCSECDKRFTSWQERDKHQAKAHPEPKEVIQQIEVFNDYHRLQGGLKLKLGDRISLEKEGIITKIKRIEGEERTMVEIAVLKDNWNEL